MYLIVGMQPPNVFNNQKETETQKLIHYDPTLKTT